MMISSPLIRLSIQEAMPTNCTRQDAPKVLARTFCVCRVINVWNSLPNTVCFNSHASFKRSLKGINFSEFLKCY